MSPRTKYEPHELDDVPLLWQGDVAVVGGGSAGSAAAVASARSGASTLLIESGGFLGGTGARVLDTFYGYYPPGGNGVRVVGGVGWEVCERLTARGDAFERPNTYGAGTGVTYEPEALKVVWDELVAAAGASTLLYGIATGVVMDGQALTGILVETKQGPRRIAASSYVDATGDGEIAWRAGAMIDNSEGVDRRQPATTTFRVGGVADDAAPTAVLHGLMREASERGDYDLPRLEGSIHITCLPGVRHANMTRISGSDLTDPWQLTVAEQEGRRQVQEYVRFLSDRVPGYEHVFLLGTSTRIGVRESRRLVGEYVLNRDDFLLCRSHKDDIALCGAPIEDHGNGTTTLWEYVGGVKDPDGRTYGIPYRSLVPRNIKGLLVAGRCFSASHEAHASARSIAQCTAMGHAAGTASALAASQGGLVADVDIDQLRQQLSESGAVL
jgi:hypothetical protein